MNWISYSFSFVSSSCWRGWKASRGTHLFFWAPLTQAPPPSIQSMTPSIVSPLINVTLTLSPGFGRDMMGANRDWLGYDKTLTWASYTNQSCIVRARYLLSHGSAGTTHATRDSVAKTPYFSREDFVSGRVPRRDGVIRVQSSLWWQGEEMGNLGRFPNDLWVRYRRGPRFENRADNRRVPKPCEKV